MLVLLTPREKNKPIEGIINSPKSLLLKTCFPDIINLIDKLDIAEYNKPIECKIEHRNDEYELYVLRYGRKVFLFSNISKEADFEHQLKIIKNRIRNKCKRAKHRNYMFTDEELTHFKKINNMKSVSELTLQDIIKVNNTKIKIMINK